jgi:PAS domain S-box-containing protein
VAELDLARLLLGAGAADGEAVPESIERAMEALELMASTFLFMGGQGAPAPSPRTAPAVAPASPVEAAPAVEEAIAVVDERGVVQSFNEAAAALFGAAASAVVGQRLAALLEAPQGVAPLTIEGATLRLGPGALGRRRDGSSFPLEVSAAPLTVAGARVFVLVLRDVGARLRAEEELRRSQTRYRMLVEQIPAVTFMANLGEGLNEIYIGPQIETLLGFTQQEWLENPVIWYWQLHPDDRARWVAEFARGCQTGGPFRSECRFIARDGRIVWLHGEARVIRDDAGRPIFIQGVAFDITEAKLAEEKLREAQEARSRNERLAAIGQLAGGVAHDLRNPLGAIRNAWYFVSKKVSAAPAWQDKRVAQLATVIDTELARCGRIIGDLLDFARDRAPYRVPCPVDELVRDSLSVVVRPAPTIELAQEVPPDLPVPNLDRDQLRQVIVNLAQNAAEAVDPARGRVVVRASMSGPLLQLAVADNGAGIPPEVRRRLFEPLFTTKTKGTGLGLSIVANMVKRHGGSIACTSEPGRGTTFTVTLPLGEASGGAAPMAGGAADLR